MEISKEQAMRPALADVIDAVNAIGDLEPYITAATDAWLDEHPEATTTVLPNSISTDKIMDGAVTDAKLAQSGGVLSEVAATRFLSPSLMHLEHGVGVTADDNGFAYATNLKRAAYIIDAKRPVRLTYKLGSYECRFIVYRNVGGTSTAVATLGDNATNGSYQSEVVIPDDGYAYAVSALAGNGGSTITDEQYETLCRGIEMYPAGMPDAATTPLITGGDKVELSLDLGAITAGNIISGTINTKRVRTSPIIAPVDVTVSITPPANTPMVFSVYGPAGTSLASNVTKYDMPANTLFRIIGTKAPEATIDPSELADIHIYMERKKPVDMDRDAERLLGIFEKITVIGDSLACGFTSTGGTTHNSATAKAAGRNWPTYLGLELGRTVTNVAVGGTSAHDWRTTHIGTANVPTDCYLIGLGVNDVRQSLAIGNVSDIAIDKADNEDTFYGNYDYILRSCLEYNPNCQIFAFTIPDTEANAAQYNAAIRAIAALYTRVNLIDLANLYPTEYVTGVLATQWNGHSTPLGYMIMASMIRRAIAGYMCDNAELFTSSPWS